MGEMVPAARGRVELPCSKCASADEAAARQFLSCDVGRLVVLALDASHLSMGQAAAAMGISQSLLARQLQNLDNQHVSLQRLFRLPNSFWRELWFIVAERRQLARVRRRIVFDEVA